MSCHEWVLLSFILEFVQSELLLKNLISSKVCNKWYFVNSLLSIYISPTFKKLPILKNKKTVHWFKIYFLYKLFMKCINNTCKFFFLWNVIDLALTLRSLMSTLFPQRTIGMFSHTLTRSLCQLGTFLYVTLEVTSNMIMAHWPWM